MPFKKIFTALAFIAGHLTGVSVQASDVIGSQAPVLEKNMMDAASIAALKKRCDEAGLLTFPNRTVCERTVNKAKLTQSSYNTCLAKYDRLEMFLDCIVKADGRDYPPIYLEVCQKARSKKSSENRECQEYLAQAQASFDSEAFKFCLKANHYAFEDAKPCLNAIRDRQVDAQNLKRTCIDELSMGDRLNDCIARMTDKAQSLTICAGSPRSATTNKVNTGKR